MEKRFTAENLHPLHFSYILPLSFQECSFPDNYPPCADTASCRISYNRLCTSPHQQLEVNFTIRNIEYFDGTHTRIKYLYIFALQDNIFI